MSSIQLAQGDALAIPLPDNSVHCVVTSPPYWALRDYGIGEECGELGIEARPDCMTWTGVDMHGRPGRYHEPGCCHVCNLVLAFREVRRCLNPSGTLWLNYGDVYAQTAPRGSGHGYLKHPGQKGNSAGEHGELGPQRNLANMPPGVKKGDRLLLHARIALALQADGWWVRAPVIWHKPNPMPSPAQVYRRPVDSYEMLYMMVKDYGAYYYDAYAIREGGREHGTRHKRDVWEIPTQGYKGAHFATYPEKLVEPCILASTSEFGVCSKCKAPYARVVEKEVKTDPHYRASHLVTPYTAGTDGIHHGTGATTLHKIVETTTLGWEPTCDCTFSNGQSKVEPALVLDPFVGSGTTCLVAWKLGRRSVGLDISLDYLRDQAGKRLSAALRQGRLL